MFAICDCMCMQSFLRIAYHYNQQELLQKLLIAAKVKAGRELEGTGGKGTTQCLLATATVLEALQQLHQGAPRQQMLYHYTCCTSSVASCCSTASSSTPGAIKAHGDGRRHSNR
jgi:hypothetical protein